MLDVKTDRPHLLSFYGKFGFEKQAMLPNYYRDGTDRFLLVREACLDQIDERQHSFSKRNGMKNES